MFWGLRTSINNFIYDRLFAKHVDLSDCGPVVSFTFDDFPGSALLNGGKILERHGAKGTYYLAPGLCETSTEVGDIISREDIYKCYESGHEIGHHTYSHLDCSEASKDEIMADILKADKDLGEIKTENFSFPFGRSNTRSKRILGKRFKSCRGINAGINSGIIDAADLKSNAIYSRDGNLDSLTKMIIDTKKNGGWLIFYTHDVTQSPGPYGCTENDFEYIVEAVMDNGVPVATVEEVINKYL